MSDEATSTDISDPETATRSLAAMAARAEVLQERLAALTGHIAGLESSRPWGTAEEFGGRFEKVYHAGSGGAEFVRENVHTLADQTAQGATAAHRALTGSVQLDQDGAALFRTPGSDGVADRVSRIAAAAHQQDPQLTPDA